MARYGVNAQYIFKRPKAYRQLVGFIIGFLAVTVIEFYFIYSYCSYVYLNGSHDFITDLFGGFGLLFTRQSVAMPLHLAIPQIFGNWLQLWWFNLVLVLMILLSVTRKGNFAGVEAGSAHFAGKKERADFKDSNHTIPIQDGLYLNPENKQLKNLNEIVIGDTGAGKTYQKLIPDILQLVGSYVITDTKGALYRQTAKIFEKNGYRIKVLNLYEISYSNTFNPLHYINPDEDGTDVEAEVDKIVNTFILNSRKDGAEVGDAFWEDTMSMLMTSIIDYLVLERVNPMSKKPEEINFTRIMDLVVGLEVVRGMILPTSEYEEIMQYIEMRNPMHPAVMNYKLFKKSAAETLQSILISLASRLRFWTTKQIRVLTQTDEMEIDTIADEPTVVFIIIPDNDNTYKVISSMFITTLFRRLYHVADHIYNGRLPNMVTFELDEFASIGKIPNYDGYIATMRSRNIRSMIILQNLQQLEKLYDKADKTIVSNSLVFNYLGTNDVDTREKVVKMLGKTTIQKVSASRNFQNAQNSSESENIEGRDLITLDELNKMDGKYSLVFVSGYSPFFGLKIQTPNLPHYELLGYDKGKQVKNNTDIHITYGELKEQHMREYDEYIAKAAEPIIANEEPESDESDAAEPSESETGGEKIAKDIQDEMEKSLIAQMFNRN